MQPFLVTRNVFIFRKLVPERKNILTDEELNIFNRALYHDTPYTWQLEFTFLPTHSMEAIIDLRHDLMIIIIKSKI
jgi:hypothetical protein